MDNINKQEDLEVLSNILSEDDVRSKIVLPWLVEKGFNLNDLSIEFSFCIRLGRSVAKVEAGEVKKQSRSFANEEIHYSNFYPRADILVRNSEGKNLFIIEVKRPNECLNNDARDQGISYARLLLNGNIAPCVVLTNGNETKIFDTFTKEEITDSKTDLNIASYVQNFRVNGEDLALQAEALESLISLSSKNLISFCQIQTSFRMRPLRSEDLNSNKKYIPCLYVERKEAQKKLLNFIEDKQKRVIVLIGAPQIGKTNFICHMVEDRLKQGIPCLFYPAIGLKQGLLGEIAEDFGWVLKDGNNNSSYIFHKLINVLRRANKRLIIFIDGWNETNIKLARTIDQECERLACDHIQIIITLTHVAASRLLKGEGGNPSYIAEAASIPIQAVQLIEISPESVEKNLGWSVVNIKKYSSNEYEEAYTRFGLAYNVNVPKSHQKVNDPYMLGVAMNLFQGEELPDFLEEPILLERIIKEKINRTIGLTELNIELCLAVLAEEMLINDAPVDIKTVSKIWKIPVLEKIPAGFFDSALLANITNEFNFPAIDFYYGKERDYIISYWARNWLKKIKNKNLISEEFGISVNSNAGLEALRWFLKQNKHIELIREENGKLPIYENPKVQRILMSSLIDLVIKDLIDPEECLNYAIDQAIISQDNLVKIEAVKLVTLLANDSEEVSFVLPDDSSLKDFIEAILSVDEEYPLESQATGVVVLDALRSLHWDFSDADGDMSIITNALADLVSHESKIIRKGAATCLGYVSPIAFFEFIIMNLQKGIISNNSKSFAEYQQGIENAERCLDEMYYGSMCPGAFAYLKEDEALLREEYEKMYSILQPIISVFPLTESIKGLISLLEELKPQYYNDKEDAERPFLDLCTLPLPFDD